MSLNYLVDYQSVLLNGAMMASGTKLQFIAYVIAQWLYHPIGQRVSLALDCQNGYSRLHLVSAMLFQCKNSYSSYHA